MTPIGRFIRDKLEKALRRYYEGFEVPKRISDMVVVFAEMHPRATRAEWVDFAQHHASEAYRSGYVRGYEHVERDPDFYRRATEQSEALARAMDRDWEWSPPFTELSDPGVLVTDEEEPEMEKIMRQLADVEARRSGKPRP